MHEFIIMPKLEGRTSDMSMENRGKLRACVHSYDRSWRDANTRITPSRPLPLALILNRLATPQAIAKQG